MMRLVSAWVLVNGLLMSPQWLSAHFSPGQPPAWVALEAALVVGAVALLPRSTWSRALAWTLALAVVLVTLTGLTDLVFFSSLGRSFNLFVDLYLIGSVYDLAVGNLGAARSTALGVSVALALALAAFALAWLLAPASRDRERPRNRLALRLGGVALVLVFPLGLIRERAPGVQERLATPMVHVVREQARHYVLTRRERALFAAELVDTPGGYGDVPGLLEKLRDRDVLVAFIESYGMAALDDPEFAEVVGLRLETLAAHLSGAGIHIATATLTSPTRGGQSWYAHSTMMSGLWVDNQLRYDLLMTSERETLVDDFRRTGHRTVALMPAITTSWPEGARLGYDDVFTLPTIPYAGPPIYWVSMPDQFTWEFMGRTIRAAAADGPHFVEAALVSSHAPWTPVLPILHWDSIGDGVAFEPFRQEGHPPEELWVDIAELRKGYARSLDYSLRAMAGFAERFVENRTLLIVLGDHQAAPWVTGSVEATVPMHVIVRDPDLLEPFLSWGFRQGAFPDPEQEPRGMNLFRDWFVHAFSDPGAARLSELQRTGP